jgi:hypothetical protein
MLSFHSFSHFISDIQMDCNFSVRMKKLRLISTQEIIRGLERTRTFFFVLKSLVPTQSSQDKEKFSCPFQSTDNFPEWKLAFSLFTSSKF